MAKYTFGEAFCLMWYACKCGHRERVWNSRDGITPVGMHCSSCGGVANHVEGRNDVQDPDHQLQPGQGYWRDGTPDDAERIMRERIRSCVGTPYECDDAHTEELVRQARNDRPITEGGNGEFTAGWPMFDRWQLLPPTPPTPAVEGGLPEPYAFDSPRQGYSSAANSTFFRSLLDAHRRGQPDWPKDVTLLYTADAALASPAPSAERPSPQWYRHRIMDGDGIDPIAGPLPPDLARYECSNPAQRHSYDCDPRGHCPKCVKDGHGNWSCVRIAAPSVSSAPSAPPSVAGDAGELPDLLDSIADDTRGHSLNGEQHDGLRNAANLIRRLATAEQPGSAVQGEAEGFISAGGLKILRDPNWGGAEIKRTQHDEFQIPVYTTPPPAPAADPAEQFCDGHCTWSDHHPDCVRASPAAEQEK